MGESGKDGFTGRMGDMGEKGDIGEKGEKGDQGIQVREGVHAGKESLQDCFLTVGTHRPKWSSRYDGSKWHKGKIVNRSEMEILMYMYVDQIFCSLPLLSAHLIHIFRALMEIK